GSRSSRRSAASRSNGSSVAAGWAWSTSRARAGSGGASRSSCSRPSSPPIRTSVPASSARRVWSPPSSIRASSRSTRRARLTASGALIGTLDYMSPEHVQGLEVDGRADQYSLACLLFAALTGEPPYAGPSEGQVLVAHLAEPVPLASERRPGLPTAVDEVL